MLVFYRRGGRGEVASLGVFESILWVSSCTGLWFLFTLIFRGFRRGDLCWYFEGEVFSSGR